MNLYDTLLAKALSGSGGGGGEPVIEALSVTENGTYTAPSGVDGYSPVTVNVSGGGSDAMFAAAIDRSIVNLVIPSGATKVGHSAFRNCTNLESVIIPQSVTALDLYAFSGCSSLMDITLLRTDAPVTAGGSNSLTSVPSNCNIWVPANLVDRYKITSVWDARASYIKAIQ